MQEICSEKEPDRKEESDMQEQAGEAGKPVAAFEGIYDRLPDISVKSVDRFIIICVIVLILVILVGILRARHII